MSRLIAFLTLTSAVMWAQPARTAADDNSSWFENRFAANSVPPPMIGPPQSLPAGMESAARTLASTVPKHDDQSAVYTRPPMPTAPAGVVSADELRHPLSSKARKMIRRAQDDAHKGEHEKAIAELQLALKEPSAVPYARSMMGAEYLRMNRPADALQQLNEAVRLLPHDVATRADFGLALYLTGEKERGEEEVRVALAEDQHNVKTIFLLDKIREQRGEAPRQ